MIVALIQVVFSELNCGFTPHFAQFLANAYSAYAFQSKLVRCGQFGGFNSSSQKIQKVPIIFIHGNSDVAFGKGAQDGYKDWQTGFRKMAGFMVDHGYTQGQLYTFTWGNGNDSQASQNYHTKKSLIQIRAFIKAVLQYTKSSVVNVIGHSMGVTLARKAIKGGNGKDEKQGSYSLGDSIKSSVQNFIGIAGANLGLTACYGSQILPACSKIDGFYPGLLPTSGPSTFLADLKTGGAEAQYVYSIWSQYDDLIGFGCVVYGKVTSRIEGQMGQVVKKTSDWTHFKLRDQSGSDVLQLFAKTQIQ